MAGYIGAKESYLIGIPTTQGGPATVFTALPVTNGDMKPEQTKIDDKSGYGKIDDVKDTYVVMEKTSIPLDGEVKEKSFGMLLIGAMGQLPTTTGASSPYTHTWTLSDQNEHKDLVVRQTHPVGSYEARYVMLDELEISTESGKNVEFKSKWIGKKKTTIATPTVTYDVDEQSFRASQCKIYFADTLAGLSGATALCFTSLKMTFKKNLLENQCLGSDTLSNIWNQRFGVTGDFELIYTSDTFQDMVLANQKKAMKIELIDTTRELVSGQYPTLTITLEKVSFSDWGLSGGVSDIRKASFGFTKELGVTDNIKIVLKNARASYVVS